MHDTRLAVGNNVVVRQDMGEVLLAPGVKSNAEAVFLLSRASQSIHGKYELSESSCACTGKLPEHIEVPENGLVSIKIQPNISFQNEITRQAWYIKYVPTNNFSLPSINLQLEARLIPRIRYNIQSAHNGNIIPINVRSPHFELDISSARRNDESEIESDIRLEIINLKARIDSYTVTSLSQDEKSLLHSVIKKKRFVVEPEIGEAGWQGLRTELSLLVKIGSHAELMIPVILVADSDITVTPEKLFLGQKTPNELSGVMLIKGKNQFAIEKVECELLGVIFDVDLGRNSTLHKIVVRLPLDRSILNKSISTDSVKKGVVRVWTTHPDQKYLEIPFYTFVTNSRGIGH